MGGLHIFDCLGTHILISTFRLGNSHNDNMVVDVQVMAMGGSIWNYFRIFDIDRSCCMDCGGNEKKLT